MKNKKALLTLLILLRSLNTFVGSYQKFSHHKAKYDDQKEQDRIVLYALNHYEGVKTVQFQSLVD